MMPTMIGLQPLGPSVICDKDFSAITHLPNYPFTNSPISDADQTKPSRARSHLSDVPGGQTRGLRARKPRTQFRFLWFLGRARIHTIAASDIHHHCLPLRPAS